MVLEVLWKIQVFLFKLKICHIGFSENSIFLCLYLFPLITSILTHHYS